MTSNHPIQSRLLPRLAVVVLLVFAGCGESAPEATAPSATDVPNVEVCTLTIEFNGRAETKSLDVACNEGMTVASALETAQKNGDIRCKITGNGETAFVVSIDEVVNEGASGDNWFYHVNKKLGDRSSGVFEVAPGDQILWSFGKYEFDE